MYDPRSLLGYSPPATLSTYLHPPYTFDVRVGHIVNGEWLQKFMVRVDNIEGCAIGMRGLASKPNQIVDKIAIQSL
jgi:hypothetical protein